MLIHPIGVGLSSRFWDRFIKHWRTLEPERMLLAPDLLGCGNAPCPPQPLTPDDWAKPLISNLKERGAEPVVLISQGASLPIALALQAQAPELVVALVAISPPGWRVLSEPFPQKRAQQLWTLLFSGPLGSLFYRYARRRGFLASFSRNNLFAEPNAVDDEWLETLQAGSRAMESRWAVFTFLAGFWRRNWAPSSQASRFRCRWCSTSRPQASAAPAAGMMPQNAWTLTAASFQTRPSPRSMAYVHRWLQAINC